MSPARALRYTIVGAAFLGGFLLLSGCGFYRTAFNDPNSGYAPAPQDAQAKTFAPPAGKAAIYLFERKILAYWIVGMRDLCSVLLDNNRYGDFGWNGYFYWVVEPGEHTVIVSGYKDPTRYHTRDWLGGSAPFVTKFFYGTLRLNLKEGDSVFIQHVWELKLLIDEESILQVLDAKEGKAAIERRHLVTDP